MRQERKYNPALKFIRGDVKGNLLIGKQYVNGHQQDKLPFERLMRWMSSPNPQRREKKDDRFRPAVLHNPGFAQTNHAKLVWLGHSSFYLQLENTRILTDPVFSDLTPFLKRRHGLPCPPDKLVNIDYILLSHGHRDHLDLPSLKLLARQNPDAEVLCPLGFEKLLRPLGFRAIQEAAWWQQYETKNIAVNFLPAKHWNRRLITDYNTSLWGSFSISKADQHIYFAGDTGYGPHFREIADHFTHFDVCLMPVGAYKPRYVMEWAHISPEEAVQAFHELGGKTFIPMHYGTFDLSDEPASEPKRLLEAMKSSDILRGELALLKVGEEFSLHRN